jgi:hypothetical protein
MRMSAAFFLMEDDNAGMTFQAQLLFCRINRILEFLDGYILGLGRIQAEREHELLALGAKAQGIHFLECPMHGIGCEASYLMDFDMLVFVVPEKMHGKLLGPAAL